MTRQRRRETLGEGKEVRSSKEYGVKEKRRRKPRNGRRRLRKVEKAITRENVRKNR